MQRRMTLLVLLATLAVACTTGTPDPSPTTAGPTTTTPTPAATTPAPGRVAVVVAPDPALTAAATEIGVRGIARRVSEETEVRVVTADDTSFVEDLTTFFATEGYDLVCAVGSGAERAVRRVARTAPSTRFCAAPSVATDLPPNVLPVDVRIEELGYVAGVALAADGAAGPFGMMTSSTTWQPQRLQAGFVAGLAAAGLQEPAVQAVGPVRDEEVLEEAVVDLLAIGADGILSLTGELDAVARRVLVEEPVADPTPTEEPTEGATGDPSPEPAEPTEAEPRFAGLAAGPEARPEDDGAELAELLLVVLELHLEEAVAVAVDRHVDAWDTAPASVGLAEEVFRVEVGTSPRARAVADAVAEAVAAIRDGTVEVPAG